MKNDRLLVIGACGRIGTDLTATLVKRYGNDRVIAADRHQQIDGNMEYMQLDVLDHASLRRIVRQCGVSQVYLLAAMLSANGEKDAKAAWKLNMQGLLAVLEVAREYQLEKVFWPSSIAVFGPGAPQYNCGQFSPAEPKTVYGISKKAGEHWCSYYFEKYGVDVRSIRYPGLIGHAAKPVGGTTDYAVDIFHQALENQCYTCYLREDTCLPMLYMPDAIRAAIELMEAPAANISVRTSYNIAGMSFAPCDLAAAITRHIPDFSISYEPDHRQAIADSWPAGVDDLQARHDWCWKREFGLKQMSADMILNIAKEKSISPSGFAPKVVAEFYPDNY